MLLLFVRGTVHLHLIGLVENFSLQVRADFRKSCFFYVIRMKLNMQAGFL